MSDLSDILPEAPRLICGVGIWDHRPECASSTTATTTAAPSATAVNTASTQPTDSSAGQSAALIVVIVILALLSICIAMYVLRRYHKKKAAEIDALNNMEVAPASEISSMSRLPLNNNNVVAMAARPMSVQYETYYQNESPSVNPSPVNEDNQDRNVFNYPNSFGFRQSTSQSSGMSALTVIDSNVDSTVHVLDYNNAQPPSYAQFNRAK